MGRVGGTLSFEDYQSNPVMAHKTVSDSARVTAGPTYVNLRGEGGVGNGVTDDSAAIRKSILAAPSGATLRVPAGEYMVDAATLRLLSKAAIWGDGSDSSWFTLIGDTSDAALAIECLGVDVRTSYGARVRGIGINLANAPHATGIRLGVDDIVRGAWTACEDIRVEGGAISLDCQAVNALIKHFHFINPSQSFVRARENGLELRIYDGIFDLSPGRTVDIVMDISVTTGGAKGAVYMRDVALNNSGTVTSGCVLVQCPDGSTASLPIRATNCTWDNLTVPAYDLRNVTDSQIMGGWANCAAGVGNGGIRFKGGGAHTIMGLQQLNGGSGEACSFDLVDGPAGLTLVGCNPSTGPYYRITGAAPTDLLILDRIWQVAGLANVTNDMETLLAALSPQWTPPRRAERPYVRESGTNPPAGYATFPGGAPNYVVVTHTGIKSTSRVHTSRERFGGTPGHISCSVADHVVGTSFTVFTSESSDTGSFYWWIEEVY